MIKSISNKKLIYFLLVVIILLHSFILTKLIFFPYPELFVYPYLTNNGLKPYSQILDQHFPGLMFLPINFNNLGITTPEIARVWLIVIIILTHLLLFLISQQIFKSSYKALVVNFLYLIWQPFFEGWVLWIDSFLPLFLLPAFYFASLGEQKNSVHFLYKKNYMAAGFFLGVSIVFKQVIVPLSFLVFIYIFWESKNIKKTIDYLYGLFPPVFLMLVYLLAIGVIKDFWYWTVVFNLTTFAQSGKQTIPSVAHFLRVFVVFGISLLSIKFLNQRIVQLLLIFLFGALLLASARFDFVHFQPALPFAILATVYGLGRLGELGKVAIIISIGYVLIAIWWQMIFYKGHLSDKIFLFDEKTNKLTSKIKQYTASGEKIFIFGANPLLYQTTKTLPAGDIFVFQFPWFLQISRERVLDGIKKDKPNIIISDQSVEIHGQKITDFARDIDQYLIQNYQLIDRVGTTDILRKKI